MSNFIRNFFVWYQIIYDYNDGQTQDIKLLQTGGYMVASCLTAKLIS